LRRHAERRVAGAGSLLGLHINQGRRRHVETSQTHRDILHDVNDALLDCYAGRSPEIVNCVGVVQP
jgi:hypothetical protein